MTRLRLTRLLVVAAAGLVLAAGSVAAIAASDDGPDESGRRAEAQEQTPEESPDTNASPWLGVLARPSDEAPGLVIRHVVPDSPAANAGLAPGDVITAIDGQAATDFEALRDAVQAKAAGDEVTLSVIKNGLENPDAEAGDVQVTLAERPDEVDVKQHFDEGFGKLLDRFVDGQFRYLDEDGNVVTMEVSAGMVTGVSADEIKIDVNGDDEGEKTFSIPDGVTVPEGLAEGDSVAVVVKDGAVEHLLDGGFPFPLPGLSPEGFPNFDGDFKLPFDGLGKALSVEVVSGTVSSVSADEITLALGDDQGEKTFTIPDGMEAPEGLEAGEEATVVVQDSEVVKIVEGGLPFDGEFRFPFDGDMPNPFRDDPGFPFEEPAPEEQEATPQA